RPLEEEGPAQGSAGEKVRLPMGRLLALTIVLAGCHASPPPKHGETEGAGQGQETRRTSHERGEPVVAASPQALLGRGAVRKSQRALTTKGLSTRESGVLDRETKDNLRSFQYRQQIAATGLPDQLTLQKLDLDPKDILGKNATSQQDDLDTNEK